MMKAAYLRHGGKEHDLAPATDTDDLWRLAELADKFGYEGPEKGWQNQN